MRYSVSETAEFGDYHAGPQVIDESVRERMKALLAAVQDGSFATLWIEECETGQKKFRQQRASQQGHQIEQVGSRLRAAMPFLEPTQIPGADSSESGEEAASGKPEDPEDGVPFF